MRVLIYLAVIATISCSCTGGADKVAAGAGHSGIPGMDSLDWITGEWSMASGQGVFTEKWWRENDSLFLGSSFLISDGDTLFSEEIAIGFSREEMFYIASVSDQNDGQPALFRLVGVEDGQWMFENPAHDFPQQITYSHPHPDSLVAIVTGIDNGKSRREVFRMSKKKLHSAS